MHDTNRLSLRDCSSEVAAFNIIRRERRGHNRRLEKDMQAVRTALVNELLTNRSYSLRVLQLRKLP